MVNDLISSLRCNYCIDSKIPFIHCSQMTVVHVQVNSLPKILPVSHNDANGIIQGSNMKMTEKHDAEYSKMHVCVLINLCVMRELLIQHP